MTDEAKQPSEEKLADFPLAQFSLVYVTKDGKLCLFEDADGHLTAVRAEKLA